MEHLPMILIKDGNQEYIVKGTKGLKTTVAYISIAVSPIGHFSNLQLLVGKDKAEKVYYRALTTYLTKSSKFTDCRIAVIKAATDLYTVTEVNAAKKAFDEVGILGEVTGNYQNDTQVNPGDEFILATGPDGTGMFIHDSSGKELAKITSKKVISKPSVSQMMDAISGVCGIR
jgi:hypothetical protein